MVVVSVTYPATAGTTFDLGYYRANHMKLVRDRWGAMGLTETSLLHGTGAPGGAAPGYHMVALLTFTSEEAFGQAARQHGREIMGDIRNFTDSKPVMQFNEVLE